MSEEQKLEISKRRKIWLSDNPDKHPWRNKDKFQSIPCQNVKDYMMKMNIPFVEEYNPNIADRFFSIDIAMPDKKIAIEINGNQHYNRDGSLKSYYQERHNLLELNGWNVYEIHYSACFNLSKWCEFFDKIHYSEILQQFDYFNYTPRISSKICPLCKGRKSHHAKHCISCKKLQHPAKLSKIIKSIPTCFKCGKRNTKGASLCKECSCKCDWPLPEEMKKMIWENPTTTVAKNLGVSDKAVEKFCKKHNIQKPARGFWAKRLMVPQTGFEPA